LAKMLATCFSTTVPTSSASVTSGVIDG
jgi:hypothetical protein